MYKVIFLVSDGENKVSEPLINAWVRILKADLEAEGFKIRTTTIKKVEKIDDASNL